MQAQRELTVQQKQVMTHMELEIDRQLDHAFEEAETGVDNFLDWNFSLKGQYTQLLFLSRSIAAGESSLAEHLGERMDVHIDGALGPELNRVNERLSTAFNDRMQQAYEDHDNYLDKLVRQADCATPAKPDLQLSDYVSKSLVGTGLAAGPVTGATAARAVARITTGTGARVASKPASKRIISKMFARLVSRIAAGTASGSAGAFCGPFVAVCGSAFAAATWIGMDIAINEIDEAINRQQMRGDMLAVLGEQKARLKAQLKEQYLQASIQAFDAVEKYQNQTFNIRRDAFGEEPAW